MSVTNRISVLFVPSRAKGTTCPQIGHIPARDVTLPRARDAPIERRRRDATRHSITMWLFKRQKTPTELLRENKRMLDRSIREIDRERTSMMSQEKKLIAEIKRMAKANQMGAVKVRRSERTRALGGDAARDGERGERRDAITDETTDECFSTQVMAKDLVRTRHSITKFYSLKSQLQGVSLRMQTLKSTQAMADAMRGVTSAMKSMNTKLNIPSLQNILKEFERQNEKMEMTTEVMGDAIDDAFAVDDEVDELGCNVGAELISAPAGKVSVAAETERAAPTAVLEGAGAAESAGGGLDDDLQARLDALRK